MPVSAMPPQPFLPMTGTRQDTKCSKNTVKQQKIAEK